jgi:soluble lytic murein transglycosylase-like protein
MKYLIVGILLLVALEVNNCKIDFDMWNYENREDKETLWEELIQRIIQVESNGNPTAVGDRGKAVGILQIHPIMIKEANLIIRKPGFYKQEDRLDPVKSIEIFNIYQNHYNKTKDIKTAALLWNGGPTYHKFMDKVEKYWAKVVNVEI